ncbi:MAG TPA: ribonuclease Y [Candidatus Paceibacterota bacterium]
MNTYLIGAGALALGALAGYLIRKSQIVNLNSSLEQEGKRKVDEAETKAKEIVLEAKEKAAAFVTEAKNDEREQKNRLASLESRLIEREETLDKKLSNIERGENELRRYAEELKNKQAEVELSREKIGSELQRVAKLTEQGAKEELFVKIKSESSQELAQTLQKIEKERHDEIEKKSMEIITIALQRYARSHISEATTTIFPLEDEELKGKIIGREGRNIRALERATGVEFVIDEAPDAVVISSFDPYRREVARLALQKLVKDGRIQPAKIEEKVEEAKQELNKRITEIGEAATMEVGVYDLPKEIVQLLGRLQFRTSYGQNVLTHSIEMAYLAAMMASELGLNVEVARKGALLHDIGKAIDHEVEGTHVELGIKILRKYGVDERVVQAMQSHHEDYPYATSEAYVITAADVISAGRPGARRDNIENYIKRLADLERIANGFPGIKNSYAISAGRELRVFVVPEKIDDFRALELAREIANKIQSELKFPGEIKVNVIREVRAVEYAR